jgi:hypothetical protein
MKIGDGHALAISNIQQVAIDTSSRIHCNLNELCIMIDGPVPPKLPNDTTWICEVGSPWKWQTPSRGSCSSCSVNTFDVTSLIRMTSSNGTIDDSSSSVLPPPSKRCQTCPSIMKCDGSYQAKIPTNWQALPKRDPLTNTLSLTAVIVPIGYGCDQPEGCDYTSSCAEGRNVSIPFCGSCINGFR